MPENETCKDLCLDLFGKASQAGTINVDSILTDPFCRFRLLSELFPGATELYETVAANREQWTKVSHKFTIRGLPSNNSLDFLDQEYELLQSQGAFGSDDHCLNGCLDDAEGGRGQ